MLPAIQALGLNSAAIEKAVRHSLPERVRSCLSPSTCGYRVMGDLTQQELAEAFQAIEASKPKADQTLVIKELTRLFLATRSKNADAEEWRLRLGIYAEELSTLPADCIVSGCRAWAREHTFSPSLHELIAICETFAKERSAIWGALLVAEVNLKYYGSTRSRM